MLPKETLAKVQIIIVCFWHLLSAPFIAHVNTHIQKSIHAQTYIYVYIFYCLIFCLGFISTANTTNETKTKVPSFEVVFVWLLLLRPHTQAQAHASTHTHTHVQAIQTSNSVEHLVFDLKLCKQRSDRQRLPPRYPIPPIIRLVTNCNGSAAAAEEL